jgi:hypothetical protein
LETQSRNTITNTDPSGPKNSSGTQTTTFTATPDGNGGFTGQLATDPGELDPYSAADMQVGINTPAPRAMNPRYVLTTMYDTEM